MNTILLIEDDPGEAKMYERLFTMEGFTVIVSNNGADGETKAKTANPDIILLDIMMPQKNGYDVLMALQSDENTKKIPVIMLTNLSGKENEQSALDMGAVQYVIKSDTDPKRLVEIVRDVLRIYQKSTV